MECSICCEKLIHNKDDMKEYFNVNDEESLMIEIKETMKDCDKFMKLQGLMVKRSPPWVCPTINCDNIICENCFMNSGGDLTIGDLYTCPYCRPKDYKTHFTNVVLNDLLKKIMGEKEFKEFYISKLCSI